MIYTCYEMIQDCRADRPAGWSYFLSNYVPVVRRLLSHYRTDDPALLREILLDIRNPASSLFSSIEPAPERWFVGELRQKVLALLLPARPEIEIDLETVADALAPLTLVEKQAVWFETMGYSFAFTGPMLRISAQTVEKIRARAADLIRGKVDTWRRSLLADNGLALGRSVAGSRTPDCLASKTFLDVLDGRMTWYNRETLARHVDSCWHCIDHFCRMIEVGHLLHGITPLTPAETLPFCKLLGVEEAKPSVWKRLTGRA